MIDSTVITDMETVTTNTINTSTTPNSINDAIATNGTTEHNHIAKTDEN